MGTPKEKHFLQRACGLVMSFEYYEFCLTLLWFRFTFVQNRAAKKAQEYGNQIRKVEGTNCS